LEKQPRKYSDRSIAKRLNMNFNKVYKILKEHFNGEHRVVWIEIESKMNEKKD